MALGMQASVEPEGSDPKRVGLARRKTLRVLRREPFDPRRFSQWPRRPSHPQPCAARHSGRLGLP